MAEGQDPKADRGYDFDLVKKEQGADFECTICHLILRDPYSTPCNHAFCYVCLTQWHTEQGNAKRPVTCPNCNTVYNPEKIHREGVIDRMVKTSLDVKCKRHEMGCKWQGKIIDYQGHHQMRCQYETVPCENKGCLVMELRKNLPNHQRDCEYRLTQCGYCQLTKPVIEMKNHRHECPMMKVVCSNDECNVQVLRKDVGQHLLKDCLYEKIECNYRPLGCHEM
uniref:Uncharacterized protein n=1 Tax=Clytia hemisphaerica TaxID=252671 RepID=A0A7M5TR76_9CNID